MTFTKAKLSTVLVAAMLAVTLAPAAAQTAAAPGASAPTSGIDLSAIDPEVRAGDDFFRHANGRWLKNTPIPADRPSIGAFAQIHEATQDQLLALIDDAAREVPGGQGAQARQIGDLYASFMDTATVNQRGVRPLAAELAAIDAITSPRQLGALFARLDALGASMPIGAYIGQDARQATRYVPHLSQSGLGLPDRDFYLKLDDAKFTETRAHYVTYLARLLVLSGDLGDSAAPVAPADGDTVENHRARKTAADVLALETELARVMTTRVENRDPNATYHRVELADLPGLAPAFDWPGFLTGSGFAGRTVDVIVRQPTYLSGLNPLLDATPLATWKAYATTHLLNTYAPYLSQAFIDARFAFVGTALNGILENRPRWKRGVTLVDSVIGEGLGRLYVARYFPAANQARMENLVANLLAAYRQSIDTLDWMSPATKQEAQAKLATFVPKIGYPKRWIDYSSLKIARDDLAGNVMRTHAFDNARQLAKLGKPVDRDEWFMTPQTVNAYYNPSLNEIVFPAVVLQPPFFQAQADDAVNYGAIGAVIGHEISHGFDDKGSQFDGSGNLRDWWTPQDRARFKAKTQVLVAQYAAFVPVPGYTLNGELTLGENIADNSGLAIAYKAYHLSLGGKPAPTIDGLTGDQRFFMGFAQVWRGKTRDAALLSQIKSDPHSPNEFRVNGTLRNQSGFHATFGVEPGDPMYLPPAERASLW